MATITILETVLFTIAVIGFIFGLILLILKKKKKIIINISALTLILTVLFINLIKDIKRAVKYVTIG